MNTKPRYIPATVNIDYKEGDTGDIVLLFSDVIDLSDKDLFAEVKDEDDIPIFTKDSANSAELIWENRYLEEDDSDFDPDASDNTFLGYRVAVLMKVEDTKHHESATHKWEIEMYGPTSEDVYTIVKGAFVITKEIAEHV
jgi:hypothetical protein